MTVQTVVEENAVTALQRSRGAGRLSAVLLDGKVRLKDLYQQGNAKLRVPRGHGRDVLEAVMINTAGGMTGGDDLSWEFDAGPGATLCLTTQASEKIYRSSAGTADTTIILKAGSGSRVSWLPQETILYDRCSFRRTIHAELDRTSEALFIEPVVFGRTAMNEQVFAGSVRDRWRIYSDGELIHAEDFAIEGRIADTLKSDAVAGGAGALATVLLVSRKAEVHLDDARRLTGKAGGASAWHGKLLIRLIAKNGYELRNRLMPIVQLLDPQTAIPKLWTL
ncbi:MAG: urease accessory protein UreD [Rhizobiaceae bacterium]